MPLSSVLQLPVPLHTFPSGREAAYWRKTSVLSAKDMESRLFRVPAPASGQPDRDRNSPEMLYVAALNAIVAMAYYTPNHFVPYLELQPQVAPVVATFSRVGNWVLLPNSYYDSPIIASLQDRVRWHDQLRAYFLLSPQDAVAELRLLWDWIAREVLARGPELSSEALAAGINAWHQTHDPHARLIPIAYLEDFMGPRTTVSFEALLRQLEARILPTVLPIRATYIKLDEFYQISGATLTTVKSFDPRSDAYILDLRGNSGSYFEDARQILNIFLDPTASKRQFYVTSSRSTVERESFVSSRASETRKPIVVLIDATTKSAAELVAGVFQQYKRAWLVGDTTFGKGTYVNVTERFGQGALLRESTHVLHYPNGGSPQLVGVSPDFFVNAIPTASRVINLYPNPLPRETPHFIQSRAPEIQKLTKCMDEIERLNKRAVADIRAKNYASNAAVVRALLLLQCQVHGPAPK